MVAYCLYCQMNRCDRIAELLQIRSNMTAFSPRVISTFRKGGKVMETTYPMLPGYVFVYAEEPLKDPKILYSAQGVIRWLGSSANGRQLTGDDYDFAMGLYESQGRIGHVTVIKEQDQVRLKDPIFGSYEGKVIKLDRRKQRAKVRFFFDGQDRDIFVSCEILETFASGIGENGFSPGENDEEGKIAGRG